MTSAARLPTRSTSTVIMLIACATIGGAAVVWAVVTQTDATRGQASGSRSAVGGGDSDKARVKVIRPIVEDLRRVTIQPAHVNSYETTDVYAKTAGYLDNVAVDIGDDVKAGDVLARLSIPEMAQDLRRKEALLAQEQAVVGQAEAAIAAAKAMIRAAKAASLEAQSGLTSAKAELQFRQSEYRRFEQLAADSTIPRDKADEKLNQFKSAEAAVTSARSAADSAAAKIDVEKANLAQAEANVAHARSSANVAQADLAHAQILADYATIKAPFAGIVTQRRYDSGAFIQSATSGKPEPLFTVARSDRLRIITDVPESESPLVRVGQTAVFRMGSAEGRQYDGKVARFSGALDQTTRTMRVEVELDDPAPGIRPGSYGSVTITLASSKQALLLPLGAVIFEKERASVKTVLNGRVTQKQVQLGQNDGVRVQVLSGLAPDDMVITDGKARAAPGQAVEIIK